MVMPSRIPSSFHRDAFYTHFWRYPDHGVRDAKKAEALSPDLFDVHVGMGDTGLEPVTSTV
jgi:hypothetical protein